MAELLVWPALIAYGEAAVAYAGELRTAGRPGRLGIWGVRVGWLAQTALLVVQAVASDGFPWATWAGALNLLSWLVVSTYLIWGCKPRYRMLGLAVMPLAAGLLLLAWAGGGTAITQVTEPVPALAVHAALMLMGLSAFTLAGGTAALYLWEERRLKRRDARVLRLRLPPLDSLDRLSARVALVGFAALTAGIVVGLTTIEAGDADAAMLVTAAAWGLYATLLSLRRVRGLRGRRAAWMLVAGLVLVAVVLPVTHYAT